MRIAVLSDFHLGYAWGTEFQEDSFDQAESAISCALAQKPDLILLLGDIFHDKIPKQEVLLRAIKLFKKFQSLPKATIRQSVKNKENKILQRSIPPVIGIFGTHERRSAGSANPVHILQEAGLFHNLHAESILIEINGKKIGLHGLSGVPDSYALECLKEWAPKPFDGVKNILMLHQSIKEYIPDENAISLSDLPSGFDLYLLGHIHWKDKTQHPITAAPILIPGSTICTQIRKLEAQTKKGFYIVEFGDQLRIDFVPIETRPVHYLEIDIGGLNVQEIQSKIVKAVQDKLGGRKMPIIKIKLIGQLEKNLSPTDLPIQQIISEFDGLALLKIDKSELVSERGILASHLIEQLKNKEIDISQIGFKILSDSLNYTIKDVQKIFNALLEENFQQLEILLENVRGN